MSTAFRLVIEIHLHDPRWHGADEWPPSPARLFQALLAAAGLGRGCCLVEDEQAALGWLEGLSPPVIGAPSSVTGRNTTVYVPNNDLDTEGGDPKNIASIRTAKGIRSHLLPPGIPFLFLWDISDYECAQAKVVARLADRLYQFGRGVDMAYARADVLISEAAELRLTRHPGPLYRPAAAAAGTTVLRCPQSGSLQSLLLRHEAQKVRLMDGILCQAPQPRFASVGYECPPTCLLFELKPAAGGHRFLPWPMQRIAELTTSIRDQAAARLTTALPDQAALIERVLIGRGSEQADKATRVRITPLPSIGHHSTGPAIRRVVVDIPPNCPIVVTDLAWTFAGLDLGIDQRTGEVLQDDRPVLVPAGDRSMLVHYGLEGAPPAHTWRSVTPVALPIGRQSGKVTGTDRAAQERQTGFVLRQALRHAGVNTPVTTTRVQREPFFARGLRAEVFADGSRFAAARLWHVEIIFAEPFGGPLVIGNGRYCGLGLLQPFGDDIRDAVILPLSPDTRPAVAEHGAVIRAVRRALMSLARDAQGTLGTLFSGHDGGSGPARSGQHRHAYLFTDDTDGDGYLDCIGILAPWRVDRSWTPTREERHLFDRVVGDLATVRAGSAGVLGFSSSPFPKVTDRFLRSSTTWASCTPYRATRHARKTADLRQALADDIMCECERRGLPRPEATVTDIATGARGVLTGAVQLTFAVAIEGPIMLGMDAHVGGGLFINAF